VISYVMNGLMDQITIKTPNPKCRLYWCLTGDTVSHVGIFYGKVEVVSIGKEVDFQGDC
jgi:hypothetical protein